MRESEIGVINPRQLAELHLALQCGPPPDRRSSTPSHLILAVEELPESASRSATQRRGLSLRLHAVFDVDLDGGQISCPVRFPLELAGRRGLNSLTPHRPDVPRPEDARVEVDEKILEPRLVDVRLVEVGLVCLLEGSSCGCAP